jgi:hypothetical protein
MVEIRAVKLSANKFKYTTTVHALRSGKSRSEFHLLVQFSASGAPVLAPLVSHDSHLPATIALFPDPSGVSPENLEYLSLASQGRLWGATSAHQVTQSPDLKHF